MKEKLRRNLKGNAEGQVKEKREKMGKKKKKEELKMLKKEHRCICVETIATISAIAKYLHIKIICDNFKSII